MGEIAKVNGLDIWWEDRGNKLNPTVLLIQGSNANCMAWGNQMIDALVANDLHVVIFDNRDVGKSTWLNNEPFFAKLAKRLPLSISTKLFKYVFENMTDAEGNFAIADGSNAKYDLNDMAKDAIALMDHIGIDKAHIVGASMGGMITLIIGLDYPERTLTLTPIMSSPCMGDPELSRMTPALVEGMKESFFLNLQGKYEDGAVRMYKELAGSRFPFDEKRFRELMEAAMAHGDNPYAGHGNAVGATPNIKERLQNIKAHTLVIHGTEDPIMPLDHGIAIADNIPKAKKYIMEGVGHEIPEQLLPDIISEMVTLFRQVQN